MIGEFRGWLTSGNTRQAAQTILNNDSPHVLNLEFESKIDVFFEEDLLIAHLPPLKSLLGKKGVQNQQATVLLQGETRGLAGKSGVSGNDMGQKCRLSVERVGDVGSPTFQGKSRREASLESHFGES